MQPLYQQLELFQSMPWPSRPLCSDDLSHGLWRAKLNEAMQLPYIQINPQRRIWALVFDVDRPAAVLAWQDADLPPPTWTVMTRENGHAHLVYALNAPISKSDATSLKPLRLLARIQYAMTERLGADRGYVGLITKTPTHERWDTVMWRPEQYDLNELREWLPDDLPLPKRINKSEAVGLGRNISLFDALRQWAYRKRKDYKSFEKWHKACLSHAEQINDFDQPLPFSEIKATAKSVAKWTWQKFDVNASNARFSALQAHRGKKGGLMSVASRRAARMDLQGELLR